MICSNLMSDTGSELSTQQSRYLFISCSFIVVSHSELVVWILESASATYISFPGTWMTSFRWKRTRRIRRGCIRGGTSFSARFVRSGTSGLWSVSSMMDLPRIYPLHRSHAQVKARASFSICAYLHSTGVSALDMNTTGLQFSSSCC